MPVRNFSTGGSGSGCVHVKTGATNPEGPFTLVALLRKGGNLNEIGMWARVNGAGSKTPWTFADLDLETEGIALQPGSHTNYHPVGENHWLLVFMVRPASGQKCKYYIYDFTLKTWTVKEDLAVSNITFGGVPDHIRIGEKAASAGFNGVLAAMAVFNHAFTQAEAEALKGLATIRTWLTENPLALWLFDQESPLGTVKDVTEHGADQISNEGTTVLAEEPPIPYGPAPPPRQSKGGPVSVGVLAVGEVLTAYPGTWEPEPEKLGYQWSRAESEEGPWEEIAGATGETYTLTEADEGKFVRVCVTAYVEGTPSTRCSTPTAPVEGFMQGALGEPHGFPDWQPWTARQPIALYTYAGLILNAEKTLGPLYVGDAVAVDLYFLRTAGEKAYRATLIWHVGSSRVQPYVTEQLYLNAAEGELHQRVPAEADHLTIILEPLAAGGEVTYNVLIQTAFATLSDGRLGSPVLLDVTQLKVAKEASANKTITRTAPGRATIAVAASGEGAGRTLTLEQLNSKGEWVRYLGFPLPNASALTTLTVALPPSPVRFTIGNTTAGEITVDLLVTVG